LKRETPFTDLKLFEIEKEVVQKKRRPAIPADCPPGHYCNAESSCSLLHRIQKTHDRSMVTPTRSLFSLSLCK
jgi:hypothetical protein